MKALIDAKKSLEAVLSEDQKKEYYELLKKWMSYSSPLTKLQFNSKVCEILQTPEQQQKHNKFLYSFLYNSYASNTEGQKIPGNSGKGLFEIADSLEYSSTISPSAVPNDIEHRSAASELFVPDLAFLNTKIAVYAWENGLEGAENGVAQIVMQACQTFIQNIITAMASRKMGYKIRNGNFQHGFGVPVPDPFLRNINYIRDYSQECKVEVSNCDDSFVPAFRPTLEAIEDQTIFSHACANLKRKRSDKRLDMELLYHTLREDPSIVGLNSVHSLHMLKTSLALEET